MTRKELKDRVEDLLVDYRRAIIHADAWLETERESNWEKFSKNRDGLIADLCTAIAQGGES